MQYSDDCLLNLPERAHMAQTIHPVDEVLPIGQVLAVGIQHVLVMYAGAIAVPLIIGAGLKLPKDQIAFVISSDLFACGLVTLGALYRWQKNQYHITTRQAPRQRRKPCSQPYGFC
jgi:xanthine/uracil permease